jgi:hypothetical protein
MRYFYQAFVLSTIFLCSCLSSSDDLDELPTAKVTSVTFADFNSGKKLTGAITYEGDVKAPSKIIVTWSGDLRIHQIPSLDTKTITKTIYEFEDGQITRITNVNDASVDARIDEFTYDSEGYLTEHFLKEISVGGSGFFTYKNLFYYNPDFDESENYYDQYSGAVQRVLQTRCNNLGSCYEGVFDREGEYDYFRSYIPATITKTGTPLEYTYTNNAADVSDFSGDECTINRNSGSITQNFSLYVPTSVTVFNPFELPERIGYDEDGSEALAFEYENSEYMAQLYYYLGQWLNPVYNKVDRNYYNTGARVYGRTYGKYNSAWILPRLNMATSYSNYAQNGFTLGSSERRITVNFKSTIIK